MTVLTVDFATWTFIACMSSHMSTLYHFTTTIDAFYFQKLTATAVSKIKMIVYIIHLSLPFTTSLPVDAVHVKTLYFPIKLKVWICNKPFLATNGANVSRCSASLGVIIQTWLTENLSATALAGHLWVSTGKVAYYTHITIVWLIYKAVFVSLTTFNAGCFHAGNLDTGV